MRILLVENHREFTSVVVPTFLSEHEVTAVSSRASARAALSSGIFDAVLVAYDLDDVKGDTLVRWLSSRPGAPALVAISSHEVGNDALMTAGATAVCSKLHFHWIAAVLGQILNRVP